MNRHRHHCQLCPQAYSQMDKLRFHIYLVHDNVTDKNNNKVESVICSYCQKVLSSKYAKLRHESIVHMNKKDYHCDVCDKYFSTFYGLRGHLAGNHGGQKLKCDLCSAEFSYPHTFKEHTERCSNKKQRQFCCSQCEAEFNTKRTLKVHSRGQHSNNTHVCEDCGQEFNYESSYIRHRKKPHTEWWTLILIYPLFLFPCFFLYFYMNTVNCELFLLFLLYFLLDK